MFLSLASSGKTKDLALPTVVAAGGHRSQQWDLAGAPESTPIFQSSSIRAIREGGNRLERDSKMSKNIATGAILAMIWTSLAAAPVQAGPAEMELLASYIGDWRGEGVMVGGEAPESFRCRLTVTKGTQAKINYAGRCSLVNMNLSVSGTIAFDDASRRYQAAMSSNAGFTGVAIGRRQGDRISFDLAERQKDRGGNDVRIGSKLALYGDTISVDFEVEFNESGQILTAKVPFAR